MIDLASMLEFLRAIEGQKRMPVTQINTIPVESHVPIADDRLFWIQRDVFAPFRNHVDRDPIRYEKRVWSVIK